MSRYTDLIRNINKQCLTFCGYDIFLMQDIVNDYCETYDILVDTKEWDDLIADLWCFLDIDIRASFSNADELDDFLATPLV